MKNVALFAALAAPMIAGADEVGHWYVNPKFGGVHVDDRRPTEDKDWLYGLGVGRHLNEALSLEFNLDGAQVGGGPGRSDLNLYGISLDLLGVLNRSGRVSPFISIGAGALDNDFSPGRSDTEAMAQAGLGMFVRLWENSDSSRTLSLRPQITARWSDAGSAGYPLDYIGTLGFQYSFGAGTPPPPAPLPPPEPTPPPAPLPPPPPADTDADGVTDDKDRCPGTAPGVAVDEFGCPRKGSITLEGVTFELDSARLTADSRSVLDTTAADLKKYPRMRIELQGHTDSSGAAAYNMNLSEQRANSVRTYLVEQGVGTAQLSARGYGEAQPIDTNATPDGRSNNRRVVMNVLENPGDVKVEGEGTIVE